MDSSPVCKLAAASACVGLGVLSLAASGAQAREAIPYVFVPQTQSQEVTEISTATNSIVANFHLPGEAENDDAVAVTPDGASVYLGIAGSELNPVGIADLETSTNAFVGTVPLEPLFAVEAIAITPNGAFAYARQNTTIHVISTATNAVVGTVTGGKFGGVGNPNLAISPDGHLLYAECSKAEDLCAISTSTNSVVAEIPTGYLGATELALTPDGKFIYARGSSQIQVIETSTDKVTTTITGFSTPPDPGNIAITPDGRFLYVPNGSVLSVIDTESDTVATVPGGGAYPSAIAVTPNAAFAYDVAGGAVDEISTATNAVVATIHGVATGYEIAITPPIVGPEPPPAPPNNPPAPPTSTSTTTAPNHKTTLPRLSAARAFQLPSAKRCVSRRHFNVHVRRYPGVTWTGAVIKLNHKRIRTIGRSHISAYVTLVGLPKGTFVLSITATASDGRKVTGTRTYHTCVPGSKRQYGPGKL